jgi:hypothetical protein
MPDKPNNFLLTVLLSIIILVSLVIFVGMVQIMTGAKGINKFNRVFWGKIPPTVVKTTTIHIRISSGEEDAEEDPSGNVSLYSSDLELVMDDDGQQVVGMIFRDIPITQGTTILTAHIQFTTDETNSDPASLTIQAESADDPEPFREISRDLTDRPLTAAMVTWEPPPWSIEGDDGLDQQTPDLSPLIQEVVDRDGWESGNSIVLMIKGTGIRTAKSWDGDSMSAALLKITFQGEAVASNAAGDDLVLSPTEPDLRLAVIGDFGDGDRSEARVADLVNSWYPDLVVTTGDNNYPSGSAETIDKHIGQFYSRYIGNYQGDYGPGSKVNRFWPTLGNHDWRRLSCDGNKCQGPHFDYFSLPSNERYYKVDYGLIQIFIIDSNPEEPDGISKDSRQAAWLRDSLTASKACFNLVFSHHPPYSTGYHGSTAIMRWPFQEWGADALISGHEHSYEHLDAGGYPYFINGSGGRNLRGFPNIGRLPPQVTSMVRYNEEYGAMLINVDRESITFQFFNVSYALIDEYRITKDCTRIELNK